MWCKVGTLFLFFMMNTQGKIFFVGFPALVFRIFWTVHENTVGWSIFPVISSTTCAPTVSKKGNVRIYFLQRLSQDFSFSCLFLKYCLNNSCVQSSNATLPVRYSYYGDPTTLIILPIVHLSTKLSLVRREGRSGNRARVPQNSFCWASTFS